MNKQLWTSLVLLAVIAAIVAACAQAAQPAQAPPATQAPASKPTEPQAEASNDTNLLFLGNKNIAPVVYLDGTTPSGVAVDIVHALAKHMSQPIEIKAMDWSEAQALVARGEADALIQINPTEERKKIYDFSDTLLESQFSIFTRADKMGISGHSSLHGLRVGVESGGMPQQLLENDPQIQLTIIPNFLEGFRLLNESTIDAVVVDYSVGSYVLAENKIRNIKVSGEPIAFSFSSLAVKKGNTKLLNEINNALRIIKADGTYQNIIDKWKPDETVFITQGQITQLIYKVTILALLILFLIAVIWTMSLRKELAKRKATEEQLRLASLYSRGLIEANLDPLVTISPEGKITDVNKSTEIVTGISRDMLIGTDFSEYFTEPEKAREGYREVFEKGLVRDYPLTIRHSSDKLTDVLYNATVYKNEAGEVQGVFAAARDITERKRAEESLRLAKQEAERANLAKTNFLRTMSHEFRTPLNAVLGFSKLLKQKIAGELNKDQDSFLDNIIIGGNNLLNILSQILNVVEMYEGTLELHFEKISVSETLDEVMEVIKEKAAKKKMLFEKNLDPELEYIEVDKQKFKQVFINLLDNAVKFSKDEGGIVTINTKKDGEMAKFSVSDKGIGIKEEDIDKIFTQFIQTDSVTNRKYGGVGIGLAITKQFVELHGGRIWVNSRYGDGSTFTFTLPIETKKKGVNASGS